ncbi:MAG: hypothetical protein ACREQ5_00775 [Candidatus Dormibacteria bacterium]
MDRPEVAEHLVEETERAIITTKEAREKLSLLMDQIDELTAVLQDEIRQARRLRGEL